MDVERDSKEANAKVTDKMKKMIQTAVKHTLSLSIYEGIIFPTYFKEKRMKICQKKDVIQFRNYRRYWESADRQSIIF